MRERERKREGERERGRERDKEGGRERERVRERSGGRVRCPRELRQGILKGEVSLYH